MGHTGNIKGGRGTYIGQAPTRPSDGAPGRSGRVGAPAGPGEEKTQIGRSPLEGGRTRTEVDREAAKTGIFDFAQDGLLEEGSGFERPRSTGSRAALSRRNTEVDTRFEQAPRGTGERQALPAQVTHFGKKAPGGTGERAALPGRSAAFEEAPRGTREQPRPSLRSSPTLELPLRGDGPARPSTPAVPTGTQGAEPHAPAQPLEELLPRFDEPIGQESLAHHFSEELRYLGADIRPSRLPPSERAERLWSFFLAYAEANAKDPAGQTQEGRELFRKALAEQGFTGLRDANSGRNGVEVALALLEARSPEALRERLASVRIEPGPERLPSEVSLPVEEHLERPPTERMHTERPPTERMPTERPVAEQQTGQVFDHAEQPHPVPLQAEAPRGVVVPGMVPPGALQAADDGRMEPDGVPAPGHSHRGTNKRLGSHMLWNVLHRFRDSPEFSAVEREKWNQVAFGALLILVGGALVVAMLASL